MYKIMQQQQLSGYKWFKAFKHKHKKIICFYLAPKPEVREGRNYYYYCIIVILARM